MPHRLLTVEQVAEILNVKRNTVYRWIRSGILPSIKIGALRRIKEDALEEFITSESEKPKFQRSSPDDPFLELIGAEESGKNDISEKHDKYLAQRHPG